MDEGILIEIAQRFRKMEDEAERVNLLVSALDPAPMEWWTCFICHSTDICEHREIELIQWMRMTRKPPQRAEDSLPLPIYRRVTREVG